MTSTRINRTLSAAIGLCAFAACTAYAGEVPVVENAWVREAPPGATMHAGYFTLHNRSANEIDLVDVASPQYRSAEIHRSKVEDGVATMVRQRQLTVAPGGVLRLKPGGFHVMLMHPVRAIRDGEAVDLSLSFAEGSVLTFTAPVRKQAAGPSAREHQQHQDHKMN